jgi:hypothetical protein
MSGSTVAHRSRISATRRSCGDAQIWRGDAAGRGAGSRQAGPRGREPGRVPGGRQAAGLGTTAKSAATAGQSRDRRVEYRRDRYRARAWLSTVTNLKRVADCGRVSINGGGEVGLRLGAGTAGYSGLAHCGSVWACPVCSAKIAARRTSEVEHLLRWNAARGGTVALATFTMSHGRRDRLRDLRKALSVAWRHMTQARAWKRTREQLGCDGYVRAIECTLGENGWHLHAHVLLLFDGPVSREVLETWTDVLFGLWSDGLARTGMRASRERGVDVRQGTGALDGLGRYLSKLTYEAAGGRFKRGRKGGRTPFELLDDAINTGLAEDFAAWWEWEEGSKGMQQLVWSNGLKDRCGLTDVSDQEIADEELDGEDLVLIDGESWRSLYWHADELLTVAEMWGERAALSWLDRHGYGWRWHPSRIGFNPH